MIGIKFDKFIVDYDEEITEPLYYLAIVQDKRTNNSPVLVNREVPISESRNNEIKPYLNRFVNNVIRSNRTKTAGLVTDGVICFNNDDLEVINNLNALCQLYDIFNKRLDKYRDFYKGANYIKMVWGIDIDSIIIENYRQKQLIKIREFFHSKGLNFDKSKELNDDLYKKHHKEWELANAPIKGYNEKLRPKTLELICDELIKNEIIDKEGNIICLDD